MPQSHFKTGPFESKIPLSESEDPSMLEVKHLKRVYKVKNNDPVYALNDVSLKFQESGLVFILGKSGSGKSTLLNVMGGLDKADEGEIIIDGKSSKDFTSTEMDSYRNTYLGFIFQEYNILSDFTVRENIALALQLQHKKATDEAINSILAQVDLAGYGKRKPNELSGGQKQRVAIARALVKEPKIIFGDEPTGALDSNTGRQVFETLKKLSKDKLVIIVSHDRDFAEHFGDRVIELRDGKVISDITKTTVVAEEAAAGVSLLGDNIIRIEKGHKLTAEDLPILNKALENSGEDMFISADAHVNDAFCEAARIDKEGKREEFKDTDPESIQTSGGSFASIKSHFSLGRAFKMGARSLKVKPFRLVMTILLSTIAFSLFGASASLANFSKLSATKETIKSEGLTSLSVSYVGKAQQGFTSSVINEIESASSAKVYPLGEGYLSLGAPQSEKTDNFHLTTCPAYIEYKDGLLDDFGFKLLYGETPKAEDEIMISEYAYYSYKDLGYGSKGADDYISPENVEYSSIVGKTLFGSEKSYIYGQASALYKVVGIYDSNFPSKYDQYRKDSSTLTYSDDAYSALYSLRTSSNQHNVFIKGASQKEGEEVYLSYAYVGEKTDEGGIPVSYSYSVYHSPKHTNMVYFDKGKSSLGENEVLVSPYFSNGKAMDIEETFDLAFEGAYQGPSADSGLYTSIGITPSYLFGNFTSTIRSAAIYKVSYDNYSDFFKNHLDLVKEINEGTNHDVYQGLGQDLVLPSGEDGTTYDYSNVSDDTKYQFLQIYLEKRIALPDSYGFIKVDTSLPYYSSYHEACASYGKFALGAVGPSFFSSLSSLMSNVRSASYRSYFCAHLDELKQKYATDAGFADFNRNNWGQEISELDDSEFYNRLYNYLTDSGNSVSKIEAMDQEATSAVKEALSGVNYGKLQTSLTVYERVNDEETQYDEANKRSLKIVGFDLDMDSNLSSALYMSKESAEALKASLGEKGIVTWNPIGNALIAIGNDEAKTTSFLNFFFAKSDSYSAKDYDSLTSSDFYLWVSDSSVSTVISTASILSILTQVFLYVGIAMAVFSALLFYNFISVSINNKKREIGILRAVGAKKSDVFKIFYSEAFVIAMINFLLSAFLTIFISAQVNAAFSSSAKLSFGIMQPNVFTILMLLGIALGASIISASLPVIRLANKKPIDAIQNR